jgi:hypothetical protein
MGFMGIKLMDILTRFRWRCELKEPFAALADVAEEATKWANKGLLC